MLTLDTSLDIGPAGLPGEQESAVYPPDGLSQRDGLDVITPEEAPTLPGQFLARVRRSPERVACREFEPLSGIWRDYTWEAMAREVARWQEALRSEGLSPGDRIALQLHNGRHWMIVDQAALSLGLVVVPLYMDDRPDNVAYMLRHSGARLLVLESGDRWVKLREAEQAILPELRVVLLKSKGGATGDDPSTVSLEEWLPAVAPALRAPVPAEGDLATIVYTSGTTGRPKGVMLSHRNLVSNAYAGLQSLPVLPSDVYLSFLPLSHTLERTAGYYCAVAAGACVAYNRSIPQLAEDLLAIRPTLLVSVPRIFERVYGRIRGQLAAGPPLKRWLFETTVAVGWSRFEHRQGIGPWRPSHLLWPVLDLLVARKVRARLGGRLRLAISGGAPLPPSVSRVFIGLGVQVLQGYGLTESSPVISVNTLQHNRPASIGLPLRGVRVRIGTGEELLAKGPSVMMGYWQDEFATREILLHDGWLRSGDRARIDPDGFIYITGRLKDIIVLANGEKVPPADMEMAIAQDPLFDQCVVIGEGMPYLSALVVLNEEHWAHLARARGLISGEAAALKGAEVQALLLEHIAGQLSHFPGYAQVRRVCPGTRPWSVDDGLLTPTLKLKRDAIQDRFKDDIERMYQGHAIPCQ